jgi:hypothetical protein
LRSGRYAAMRHLLAAIQSTLAAVVLIAGALPGAGAQPSPEQTVLRAIFTKKAVDPSLFAASFTAQVPVATVQSTVDTLKTQLGGLSSIKKAGSDQELLFANGSLLASIVLDSQGKITGLLLHDEIDAANQAALERVLRADHVSADWFAPSFLAQVPAAKIDEILAQMRSQEGAFQRVEVRDGSYYSVFEKDESRTTISLDAAGKIQALLFRPFAAKGSS